MQINELSVLCGLEGIVLNLKVPDGRMHVYSFPLTDVPATPNFREDAGTSVASAPTATSENPLSLPTIPTVSLSSDGEQLPSINAVAEASLQTSPESNMFDDFGLSFSGSFKQPSPTPALSVETLTGPDHRNYGDVVGKGCPTAALFTLPLDTSSGLSTPEHEQEVPEDGHYP